MVTFTSDILYGNGKFISHTEEAWGDEITFVAEHKFQERRPLWFNFRVEGLKPGTARFCVGNAHQFLADTDVRGWATNHPVYRTQNNDWERVDHCDLVYGEDGMPRVTFDIPTEGGWMEVAFCYPYGQNEVDATMAMLPQFTRQVIGYTTKGRPMYRFATDGGRKTDKPGIYIVSGTHAGEVGGRYVMDGLLRWFATEEGKKALEKITVWVLPIFDVDAVAEGAYGKDQLLGDLNRSFRPYLPDRIENDALQQDLYRWKERCNAKAYFDLHSPAHEVLGMLLNVHRLDGKMETKPDFEDEHLRMMQYVNEFIEPTGMEKYDTNYDGERTPLMVWPVECGMHFIPREYGVPYFVWENTYMGAQDGRVFTRETYRAYGACMAQGMCKYLGEE